MTPLPTELNQYSSLILAGAGMITTLGVGWRRVLRPLAEIVESLRKLTDNQEVLTQVAVAQLTTNGGGSLTDKANRIPEIETKLDRLAEAVDGKFNAIEDRFARNRKLMAAIVLELPEPQRSAIQRIVETLGGQV